MSKSPNFKAFFKNDQLVGPTMCMPRFREKMTFGQRFKLYEKGLIAMTLIRAEDNPKVQLKRYLEFRRINDTLDLPTLPFHQLAKKADQA